MPIKIDCPRCKTALAVPSKKAGGYVNCPSCSGRFWVPADAPNEPNPAGKASTGSVTLAVPPGAAASQVPPPVAAPPKPAMPPGQAPQGKPAPPSASPPSGGKPFSAPTRPAPPPGNLAPPPADAAAPPPPAAPDRKVARFITAEAAESTLKLADDGKLPELHLEEGEKSGPKQAKQTSLNPLVLFGLLAMSVVLSLVMAFIEPGTEGSSNVEERQHARYIIQTEYFADEEHLKLDNPPPLKPYQRLLRDALEAHARGDYNTERARYRQVLKLLRAERSEFEGITGSPTRDRELEAQLTILLRNE